MKAANISSTSVLQSRAPFTAGIGVAPPAFSFPTARGLLPVAAAPIADGGLCRVHGSARTVSNPTEKPSTDQGPPALEHGYVLRLGASPLESMHSPEPRSLRPGGHTPAIAWHGRCGEALLIQELKYLRNRVEAKGDDACSTQRLHDKGAKQEDCIKSTADDAQPTARRPLQGACQRQTVPDRLFQSCFFSHTAKQQRSHSPFLWTATQPAPVLAGPC